MSHCHSDKFSQKGGKCPTVILASFQKRRKMSDCDSDMFSQKGGKCPTVIFTNCDFVFLDFFFLIFRSFKSPASGKENVRFLDSPDFENSPDFRTWCTILSLKNIHLEVVLLRNHGLHILSFNHTSAYIGHAHGVKQNDLEYGLAMPFIYPVFLIIL